MDEKRIKHLDATVCYLKKEKGEYNGYKVHNT